MKWNKAIGWTAVGIGAVILFVIAGAFLVLRSDGFHRYAIAKIVEQVNQATGGRTEVRTVDFHWGTLTADLDDVTIHGTERVGAPPLLHVDRLSASLKIISVLRREVNLSHLEIIHPVIHLDVAHDGSSNIPHPAPSKSSGSSTNIFDLAVGHTLLDRGVVYYNDRQNVLSADIQDLHTEVNFSFLQTHYSGTIGYQNGHIQYAGMSPMAHALELQFTAEPSGLDLPQLVLKIGSSRISATAKLVDYSNPKVDGDYSILIHTQDFNGALAGANASGDISSGGKLHFVSMPNVPLLRAVVVQGQLESGGLALASRDGNVAVNRLQGSYQLSNGNLQVRNVLLNLLRGQLAGDAEVAHLDTTPAVKLRATLRGVSIDAIRSSVHMAEVRTMPLTGKIDGSADASWTGDVSKVRAHTDLAVSGSVLNPSAKTAVPLKAAVHADYDGAGQVLSLHQTILRTPASSLVADGQMSQRSSLNVQLKTTDLHELVLLIPASANGSTPPNIAGAANVTASVRGSFSNPQINAQVSAQNLQVDGSQPGDVRLALQATPSQVSVQNGVLTGLGQSQIEFSGHAALHDWSYLPSNAIAANVNMKKVPLDQLAKLARLQMQVSGDLNADLALQGSQLNPAGHGSIQLADAKLFDQDIQTASMQFQAADGMIHSTLNLKSDAGALTAQGSYMPRTRAYDVHLDAPAVQLDQVQALVAKGFPLTGTAKIAASGAGTLDKPQLKATIELPEVQVQQATITGIKADLSVADQRATVALTSTIAQANIQAHAAINLTDGYYTEATIDSSSLPLEPLLDTFLTHHPAGIKGETEFHATLKGPLKDKSQIEAHVTIPRLNAEYQSLQIASAGPLKADYAQSVITLQPGELKGTATSVKFSGRIPLQADAPIDLNADGSIDMRLLEIFSADVQSGGKLALQIHGTGTAHQPIVQGQVKLQNVALLSTGAPLGLENMNGTLDIRNEQIRVSQLTAQIGGGQLTAGGSITYRPSVQFNLALETHSVRLRYPDGVRTIFDSTLALVGNKDYAELNGRVLVSGLSFTSDFDLSNLVNQFSGASAPPMGASFADHVRLNVNVQSADDLAAATSQLSIEGQINLRAIGTLSDPVLVGRTDITAGDIFFMKQRYQLEQGVINFTSSTRTRPVVNIMMTTTVNQYNLSLNVTGPIEKLTTRYTSDPPLPPVDIINLIARGTTTEEAGPTTLGADSVLAAGASQLSGQVEKLAGISSLQIDPLLGGNNRNPSARVAVQRRVTKNFVFTFSTDVTDPQSEIIQGEYQINRRWSVSASRDEGGGVAVDGRYHTTF